MIEDETGCCVNDLMVPVVRCIIMNDMKKSLPVDKVIAFFSRCVSKQESLSLAPFLNLMRLFLKEYNTQCHPFKDCLLSLLDSIKSDQPLIRVLRTMISNLFVVCKKHSAVTFGKQKSLIKPSMERQIIQITLLRIS